MGEQPVITGVCVFDLHFPGSDSLKSKRQPLKGIKDTIRSRFNVSVAEIGGADLWQRSQLAVAMVASHDEPIRQVFDEIRGFIEGRGTVLVVDRRMVFY